MGNQEWISVFDMLKIGVGPSSSHTLGPWLAASRWVESLATKNCLESCTHVQVTLYGSLALTGKGHATDKALQLGLMGEVPALISISAIGTIIQEIAGTKKILLGKTKWILFEASIHIKYLQNQVLPYHSNGLRFEAFAEDTLLDASVYYSIGGGFVVQEGELAANANNRVAPKYPCFTPSELLKHCRENSLSIFDVVLENEKCWRTEKEIEVGLSNIWEVMKEAAYIGCHTEGILPGGLNVKRRAFELNQQLLRSHTYTNADEWMHAMQEGRDFRKVLTRISCIALAVNEVNAAMGRIVTAPTNGSAGVIPAVLFYYVCFSGQRVSQLDIMKFLMVAAEVGKFFKTGATISAAAGGCQAEIGVSSSMAAAALTECLGGTPAQSLMAAEIAAEHHLGMTCDPVGGLVQIPCIERNSMGAIKAITASMIALESNPAEAKVSLENVIKTMKETAENMHTKYKETSLGGLAVNVGVNVPEC